MALRNRKSMKICGTIYIHILFEIVNAKDLFCQLCDCGRDFDGYIRLLFHLSALLPHLGFSFEWKYSCIMCLKRK